MGELTYFTKADFDKFIQDCSKIKSRKMSVDKIRNMFEVLCSGAMRINEVLSLEPDDILVDGHIRIRAAKGGWKRCTCSTWKFRPTTLVYADKSCKRCKGIGKYRIAQYTFLPEPILARLRQFASDTLPGKKIFPISDRQAMNYVYEISEGHTHAFRHSWLTWLVESNKVDLARVRDMARHSSLATTDRYIQRNPELTRKQVSDASKDFI
jgi:integrase